MTQPRDILVGGIWRSGSGARYATCFPADGSVTAELHAADTADVDEAVEIADKAWRHPGWRDLAPHERARLLYRIGDIIRDRHEDLAQLQMRDNGKPINETRALVASAANTFQFMGAACESLEEEITPPRGDYLTMSTWEPMGVVAAITPWNSPIASEAQKLAPALAAGNAVILKPAEVTPLLALELGRICEQASIPAGIVSVLPGKGSVVGDALIRHPKVKKVSFTGGTATGKSIAAIAAGKLMPVTLELGGKSPTVVFDDADLDHAVNGVLFGIFSSSGESCIAGSRLFLDHAIADAFIERLVAKTNALRIGDPRHEATQMGPLISHAHRDGVEGYVRLGLEEGGELLAGGERPSGGLYDAGPYFRPTIIDGLANGARMCQEEIFGPVLAVLRFDGEDDLLAQANDSVFGLASGLWTRDYKRAWRVARQLEAGTVWINTYKQFSITTPFTARKASGIGRDKGRLAVREYMNQKSLYWGLNEDPIPWAG